MSYGSAKSSSGPSESMGSSMGSDYYGESSGSSESSGILDSSSSSGSSGIFDSSSSAGSSGIYDSSSGSIGSSGASSGLFADFELVLISWTDGEFPEDLSFVDFEIRNIGEVAFDILSITSDADSFYQPYGMPYVGVSPGAIIGVSAYSDAGDTFALKNITVVTTIGTKSLFID